MNTIKENKTTEILSAISHPNRIRILNAIKRENILCGCEILPMLGLIVVIVKKEQFLQ